MSYKNRQSQGLLRPGSVLVVIPAGQYEQHDQDDPADEWYQIYELEPAAFPLSCSRLHPTAKLGTSTASPYKVGSI